jgi:hypothetical protein
LNHLTQSAELRNQKRKNAMILSTMIQPSVCCSSRRIEHRFRPARRLSFLPWQLVIGVVVTLGVLSGTEAAGSEHDQQREPLQTTEERAEIVDPGIVPLAQLTIDVALPNDLDDQGELLAMPVDHAKAYFAELPQDRDGHFDPSFWPEQLGYGPSLNFAYRPLYFEQVGVERYGCSLGYLLQPCVSTLHFYGSAALLPYRMLIHPPLRPVYHDHHDLPGGQFTNMQPQLLQRHP